MNLFLSLVFVALGGLAAAQDAPDGIPTSTITPALPQRSESLEKLEPDTWIEPTISEPTQPLLTEQEKETVRILSNENTAHALQLIKEWEDRADKPLISPDGKILYAHGETIPLIIVKPLQLTDIELQEGENILALYAGDQTRWQITNSESGQGDEIRPHIIVKAKLDQITTSLLVNTDRRTYRVQLVSNLNHSMPYVGFNYPQEPLKKWEKKPEPLPVAVVVESKLKPPIDVTEDWPVKPLAQASSLNFNYKIKKSKGSPRWVPVTAYDDGRKTYLVMPPDMDVTEAPILLVEARGKRAMANYRVVNGRYVVDRLFDQAFLQIGVGWRREEVSISRTNAIATNDTARVATPKKISKFGRP